MWFLGRSGSRFCIVLALLIVYLPPDGVLAHCTCLAAEDPKARQGKSCQPHDNKQGTIFALYTEKRYVRVRKIVGFTREIGWFVRQGSALKSYNFSLLEVLLYCTVLLLYSICCRTAIFQCFSKRYYSSIYSRRGGWCWWWCSCSSSNNTSSRWCSNVGFFDAHIKAATSVPRAGSAAMASSLDAGGRYVCAEKKVSKIVILHEEPY